MRGTQRLVLLASTTPHNSFSDQSPRITHHFLSGLSSDEYRIALIAHPGFWHERGHKPDLAQAHRAGLITLALRDWPAALIAADAVVTDHGALAHYAAALGLPLVLAQHDQTTADTGPLTARLLDAAPPYRQRTAPSTLLGRAQAAREHTMRLGEHWVSSPRSRSLSTPAYQFGTPTPDPASGPSHPALWVCVRVDAGRVLIHRFPADADHPTLHLDEEPRYLTAWDTDAHQHPVSLASTLLRHTDDLPHDQDGHRWAQSVFAHHMATFTATYYSATGCVGYTRQGQRMAYALLRAPHDFDPSLLATLVHVARYDADVAVALHGSLRGSGAVPVTVTTGTATSDLLVQPL
ncbi:hypothetical protein AB0M72_06865 [Nocardiopsis dassonvillei]